MKNKAKMNYWIDIAIALVFLPVAGFRGGRNAAYGTEFLGMSSFILRDDYTWSSSVALTGAFLQVVLHWNWIVCMTRNIFARRRSVVETIRGVSAPLAACGVPAETNQSSASTTLLVQRVRYVPDVPG